MGVQNRNGITRQDLRNLISEVVVSRVDEAIAPLKAQSTNYFQQILDSNRANGTSNTKRKSNAGGVIRCLAKAYGDQDRAYSFAKTEYGSDHAVTKALAAGGGTEGGFLIREQMAEDVIDRLRSMSAVRKMNPVSIRMPAGNYTWPRLDTSASAAYIDENQDIPISQPVFGQIKLSPRKLAGLCVSSSELLMYSESDTLIMDDLVEVLAEAEDVSFLLGTGLSSTPIGLVNQAGTTLTAQAFSVTNATQDLYSMLSTLAVNNVKMLNPGWIMHPRTFLALSSQRDTNGNFAWNSLHNPVPLLLNMPIAQTTNLPITLGGSGDESYIILADFTDVVVGDVDAVSVEISREGSYLQSGSLVSAFSRDQVLIRAIIRHDIALKHPESVVVLDAVDWTAA